MGAVCDDFLTQNQLILTQIQWVALQLSWGVVECTPATTLGSIKAELEQLCSKTPCTYEQAQQLEKAIASITKLMNLPLAAQSLMIQ